MTNVFVFLLCKVFHPEPFETTPCPLKCQRENHTGVLASDSSHEYIVDWRSSSKKGILSPQSAPACIFSYGCVTMLSVSLGCKLSDFALSLSLCSCAHKLQ